MKTSDITEGGTYAASFDRMGGWGKDDEDATYFPVRAIKRGVLRTRCRDGILVEYLDDVRRPVGTVEVIDARAVVVSWAEHHAAADERERHLLQVQMELAERGVGSTLNVNGITISGADTEHLLKSMVPVGVAT